MILTQNDLNSVVLNKAHLTPLNVQYNQKDYAKKLGARWDGEKWGVPAGINISPFYHWLQQEDFEEVLNEIIKNYGDKPEFGNPPASSSIKELREYIAQSVWASEENLKSSRDEDHLSKISEKRAEDAGILDPLSDTKHCWNYARNPAVAFVSQDKIDGKWMVFLDLAELTEAWKKIVDCIREGRWNGHAKCATLMAGRNFFRSNDRAIIVYTDPENKDEVFEDLKSLSLSPKPNIRWKSNLDTKMGKYNF